MDIPLRDVQVIWDYHGDDVEAPPVRVVDMGQGRDDRDYFASWGACNADFNEAGDDGRLLMLFVQFHQLVTLEPRIDPEAVHEAFLVIPEYRAALPVDLVPVEYMAREEA